MADPKLPMNGKNAKLILLYGGARVPSIDGHVSQWSAKEVATKFRDSIIGRPRKRTDKTVDGFDADLDVWLPDLAAINFLKSIDDTRDANQPTKELAVALEFAERNGAVEGVILGKAVASWDITSSG